MTDPVGAAQWQLAVDGAHAMLTIEAARLYGLVTGGPRVNVDRCRDILDRGATLGYAPDDGAIDRVVAELAAP